MWTAWGSHQFELRLASSGDQGRWQITHYTVWTLNNAPGAHIARFGRNHCTWTGKPLTIGPPTQAPNILFPKNKLLYEWVRANLESQLGWGTIYMFKNLVMREWRSQQLDWSWFCQQEVKVPWPWHNWLLKFNAGQNTLGFLPWDKEESLKKWTRSDLTLELWSRASRFIGASPRPSLR